MLITLSPTFKIIGHATLSRAATMGFSSGQTWNQLQFTFRSKMEVYFPNGYFPKLYFPKLYYTFWKCISKNCTFRKCILRKWIFQTIFSETVFSETILSETALSKTVFSESLISENNFSLYFLEVCWSPARSSPPCPPFHPAAAAVVAVAGAQPSTRACPSETSSAQSKFKSSTIFLWFTVGWGSEFFLFKFSD